MRMQGNKASMIERGIHKFNARELSSANFVTAPELVLLKK